MSEVYPAQVKHFIDKDPEDLKKFLQSQPSPTLKDFLERVKTTLIKFPKSPSLLKLEQEFLNELMDRERNIASIHLEDAEEELPNQEIYRSLTWTELSAREFPAEQWLIDKIVPESGITMFVGEAAVGKSFIALDAVRALVSGDNFLDNFEVKTKGAVLIIDKENGFRRLQKRLKGLKVGASDQIYFLEYPEQFDLNNKPFMLAVAGLIKEKDIKMVVLDSFIDVLIGSENDAGDTNEVFNLLRSISAKVNWFILHHDSKPLPKTQRTAGQKTRGSSNIIAQVDNQFYIEKTKTPTIINIEQGKSRDNEPVKKFQVEFKNENEEMIGFRYIGEIQDEASKVDEASEFIQRYLIDNPNSSRQEIIDSAESEGIAERSIDRAKKMLEEKNIIDSYKNGNKKLFFISEEDGKPEDNA